MLKPIDVAITVDTEFSIGGAFAEPERFEPIGLDNVFCPAGGKENGLPFLTDTLGANDLKATFFIETMQTAWFGDAPMRQATDHLLETGHDIQMHLHPCWAWFRDTDWKSRLQREQPHDDCTALDTDSLSAMISEGINTFKRWGLKRPVAFRTGSLKASKSVYRALAENGIRLASNVGRAYSPSVDPELLLSAGIHEIETVLEAPVCTYLELEALGRRRERLLTVTSTSFSETKALLNQAYEKQVSPIVILTHPFEFVKSAPAGRPGVRTNRINRKRFEQLCAFLAASKDRMHTVTFAEAAAGRWQASPGKRIPELRVPLNNAVRRMAANRLNDLIPAL